MRQNRINISTGVIEVNYPNTMTLGDVWDFKDAMAITFRMLERIAMNGQRQEGETTSGATVSDFPAHRNDGDQ